MVVVERVVVLVVVLVDVEVDVVSASITEYCTCLRVRLSLNDVHVHGTYPEGPQSRGKPIPLSLKLQYVHGFSSFIASSNDE